MKSLGLDIGYGDVKVVIGDGNQITHIFKYSSAIARAQKVSSIRDPRIVEVNLPSGELDQVYVGPDALSLPSNMIVDIRDYQMLEAYAPAFIAKALETAEIDASEIDVMVCGLSVAQLGMSGYFKERIKQFTVSGKEYKFDKIFLLPQGAGSKLAFDMFGDHYPQPRTTNTSETYIGADCGFCTLDMFYVTDGKTSPNLFEGIENAGVTRIAQDIQTAIKDKFGKDISLREAKEILDSGYYKLRGVVHDMDEVIKEVCKQYSQYLLGLIEERYGNIIDKCDFVCLLGGGVNVLRLDDPFFRVVKNKSEFYNALGFYLYGVRQF